jgi:ClpP class serine protease
MSFIIQYKENVKITFLNVKDETINDLKRHVSKHYDLHDKDYHLLDLGRIISAEEKLIDLERNTFTVYFTTYIP